MKSTRDQIRDAAEQLLRAAPGPLHNLQIAESILPQLGLTGKVTPKTVNTCLHDDPSSRFVRVGKGTWALRSFSR